MVGKFLNHLPGGNLLMSTAVRKVQDLRNDLLCKSKLGRTLSLAASFSDCVVSQVDLDALTADLTAIRKMYAETIVLASQKLKDNSKDEFQRICDAIAIGVREVLVRMHKQGLLKLVPFLQGCGLCEAMKTLPIEACSVLCAMCCVL